MDIRTDFAWDLPSSLLNPLVGIVKHPQPVTEPVDNDRPPLPMRDPAETFAEISQVVRRVLPGARIRRRLFFRYTLEWTRNGYDH
jgi:hypothetical protein